MDKKKIVFIVITVISVIASLVACALGLPYTPVGIDYDWAGEDSEPSENAETTESESSVLAFAVSEGGVSDVTGTA